MKKHFLVFLAGIVLASPCDAGVFQQGLSRLERAIQIHGIKNHPVLERNLARWRLAAMVDPPTFVLVDTARFRVAFYVNHRLTLESRALVGQKDSPTPVFNAFIDGVVFHPWWQVPEDIAVREIAPLIKDQQPVLEEAGIMAFRKRDGKRIPLGDFSPMSAILKQAPTNQNPLGTLKFLSRNPLSILLHGTYETELFEATNRAVSHGCVRVEKAMDLAKFLLQYSGAKVETKTLAEEDRTILFPRKIPVYFQYWTAWADEQYQIHFERDIYGWDR